MWIVIETFPRENMYIFSYENGETVIFERKYDAFEVAETLQKGEVHELEGE